jgi:hypothetical protein
MSKWAALETQLLELAAWGLQMNLKSTAKLTSSFKTFSLSLEFTQSVCQARLKDTKYLNTLVDLIREVSGDRNFIAHTQVVGHGPGDPSTIDWALVEPKVGPALKEHFAGDQQKRDPMDTKEVSEIVEDIQHLVSLTMDFTKVLKTGEPFPGKFHKRVEPRRPRLAERRGKSDKETTDQPQSSQA